MDDLQSMAIEVKGGKNVGIATLRALRGVLENDAALIVGLLILEPLGRNKGTQLPSLRGPIRACNYGRLQTS